MSLKNRVFEYHKTTSIQIGNILSLSEDGTCIIFDITSNHTEFGILRAITILEQEEDLYRQYFSSLCETFIPFLNKMSNTPSIKKAFFSPIRLNESELQKDLERLQPIKYIVPKITYQLHEWTENGIFGADLYIYQIESFHTNFSQISKKESGMLKYLNRNFNSTDVFGTDIPIDSVREIIFLDTLKNIPSDAWDVSEQQDGSVMAWFREGFLHICGEGGVVANPNCKDLFSNYKNLTRIDFNHCFDTSRVTNMCSMFDGCVNLKEIDLSGFDTSKVTNMCAMFYDCSSLSQLDVSCFNTSNVTDMRWMFYGCAKLKKIDISNFHIKKSTKKENMFSIYTKAQRK